MAAGFFISFEVMEHGLSKFEDETWFDTYVNMMLLRSPNPYEATFNITEYSDKGRKHHQLTYSEFREKAMRALAETTRDKLPLPSEVPYEEYKIPVFPKPSVLLEKLDSPATVYDITFRKNYAGDICIGWEYYAGAESLM